MFFRTQVFESPGFSGSGPRVQVQIFRNSLKVKALFDQGSQRSYVTKRVKDLLKLKSICIITFGDTKSKSSVLENLLLKLKNDNNETFEIKALCTNFICLPINNQPVCDIQNKFDHLKGLKLVDSGHGGDIDILTGSDWGLVTGKVKVGLIEELVGTETQFGWVLNGPVVCSYWESHGVHFASCTSAHQCKKLTILIEIVRTISGI